jgi:predicted transcriptional regulator YheO
MTKTEELQKIKFELMKKNDWSTTQAVEFIAKTLHRSPATIYEYLSIGRANIPVNSLELLKYKI